MKLKLKLVNNEFFDEALSWLMQKPMSVKQCMEFSNSIDEVLDHRKAAQRARNAIISKYSLKDDKGETELEEDGRSVKFKSMDEKIKCQNEILELDEQEVEISLKTKIELDEKEISTPQMMYLLKELVSIKEEEKEKQEH